MEIPVILITGPSGVGKSTLLRNAIRSTWPDGLEICIPKKYTTRERRLGEQDFELLNLSMNKFNQLKKEFIVSYESYGEHYGLESQAFENPDIKKVYIQTLPTGMALELKRKLKSPWKVYVCRLEASPEEIRKRLIERGDKITLRQMVDRAKGSESSKSYHEVDFVLNTSNAPDQTIEVLKNHIFPII